MQDLKVIGVENGSLLAASDDGERYRIEIDDVFTSRLRRSRVEMDPSSPKPSPREVQGHIRAGMSAAEVAELTGAPLEYVQRFEGPIIAEREHAVVTALSVPVHTSSDVDPTSEGTPFGVVLRERLASLGATGERWASWKEPESGWILKLEFTADGIDHDARWAYETRKQSLTPINPEATTLSQQGELQGGLIPRLRAVGPHQGDADDTRFDSGAFAFHDPAAEILAPDIPPIPEPPRSVGTVSNSIAVHAIKRAEESPRDGHQTADLLEALRRRRGERKSASRPDAPRPGAAPDSDVRAIDIPLAEFESLDEATRERSSIPGLGLPADGATGDRDRGTAIRDDRPARAGRAQSDTGSIAGGRSGKRGRASMPSWDEIVFGARSDDDPA